MSLRLLSRFVTIGLKLLVAIAATELLIMLVFNVMHIETMLSPLLIMLADTLLLSIAASVMIFVWVVRPMRSAEEFMSVEEKLRESESQYRLLFDNNPSPVWLYDEETLAFLAVNRAATAHYGYSESDFLQMTIRDIRPPEDISLLMEHFEEYPEGTRAVLVRHRKKSGDIMDVQITSQPMIFKDRKARIVVVQDVTERLSHLKLIEKSEARYRLLFESSKDAIYITQREGPFLDMNRATLDLFGYSKEEMVGMDIRRVYANPEARDRFQTEIEKNGFLRDYEICFKNREGRELDCLLTSTLIIDEQDNILGYQGIIRDITDRKKMEAQLYQAKQDWEETFNTITDMITVHDRDFHIIRANKAAEQILGLPFLEMTKVKCYEYYHGTGCPPEGCPSCQVLKTAVASTAEVFEPHLNRFIEIRAIPRLDKDNELAGLIHVVRDISEQKKLAEQLRQSQKMEAVGQLAGGIAHDFNNILTAITGYGYLCHMKMDQTDPLRTNVEQILEAAERAATLTHSLLAFSRKQVISLKLINLNDLVMRFEKLLRRLVPEDIDFNTVCSAENIMVMADSGQIEQVLMNLVANARDAMPDSGKLVITTSLADVDDQFMKLDGHGKPGTYALVTVSDTGIGMDEETQRKIFEPFFTTKAQGKGTGLGLAMVYGIVKQHEGYILVRSRPGSGTTFSIYLPILRPHDRSGPEETSRGAVSVKGGSETILIAEDDPALRKLEKTVLTQFGYTVIEAVDGEDAVLKFVENRDSIRLLILDVIMPRKNGKEVYDDIGILSPGMKVLFMSGYASDIIGPKGLPVEGLNFINKPISPRDLLEKVRWLLDT
ncbi:MAG: PAS domain S-box protein [Nitrospirae bacterium]|nr:PAS domain S-box protein [Nitrospirota bacterium]